MFTGVHFAWNEKFTTDICRIFRRFLQFIFNAKTLRCLMMEFVEGKISQSCSPMTISILSLKTIFFSRDSYTKKIIWSWVFWSQNDFFSVWGKSSQSLIPLKTHAWLILVNFFFLCNSAKSRWCSCYLFGGHFLHVSAKRTCSCILYCIVHNSIWISLCLYQERVNRIHYSLANKKIGNVERLQNIYYIYTTRYIYLFIYFLLYPSRTSSHPIAPAHSFCFSFLYPYEEGEKRKRERRWSRKNRYTKTSNTYIQLNLEIFFLKLIKLAQFYQLMCVCILFSFSFSFSWLFRKSPEP